MQKICISGCGDIGIRVATQLQALGNQAVEIYGLVRRSQAQDRLRALNITPIIVDLDCLGPDQVLPTRDAVIFHFVPPPTSGQCDPRIRALLSACERDGNPTKVILLSTTAVYGDCQGQWIDESVPVNPQTDRGRRRLDAEIALKKWATRHAIPYVILRVSGIYGPGRLPIERLKKGLPILREDQAPFSNRIHQDDLATVCVAAAERAPNGSIYNVCDGHPSTMSHYFKSIARALGLPAPPEIDYEQAKQQLSAGMFSYLSESRRLSNARMLDELKISLRYPDLATGLAELKPLQLDQ